MKDKSEQSPSKEIMQKYQQLLETLKSMKRIAVAYSGGVDSTFLLYAAKKALGEELIAVTAASHSFPGRERKESEDFCRELKVKQVICEIDELKIEGFAQNPKNRCYICKKVIFENFLKVAKEHEMTEVVEGSNMDDLGDYRPGHLAITELGIKSPLRMCGFTKEEIRIMSRYLKLPTWDKPSFACLASRFPYGDLITAEKLEMVEKAEQFLLDLGFSQFRVRIHGTVARIELLPEDFTRFMEEEIRKKVYTEFVTYGFSYIALDIRGFRSGSMNEAILKEQSDEKE